MLRHFYSNALDVRECSRTFMIIKNECSRTFVTKSVQIRSFFWSVFFRIRTEYGEILRISPYSVWMRENTDQKELCIWTFIRQCHLFIFESLLLNYKTHSSNRNSDRYSTFLTLLSIRIFFLFMEGNVLKLIRCNGAKSYLT